MCVYACVWLHASVRVCVRERQRDNERERESIQN